MLTAVSRPPSTSTRPTSRHTTPEKIDLVARGRVWTGRQAQQQGLVDTLGGLDAAVAIAKQRANIPADEDVELVAYPPRRTFYEAISEQFGRSSIGTGVWGALTGGLDRQAIGAVSAPIHLFRRGEPLALMPWSFVN